MVTLLLVLIYKTKFERIHPGIGVVAVLLLCLNFANMYWTLSSYLKSIKIRGEVGDKGPNGCAGSVAPVSHVISVATGQGTTRYLWFDVNDNNQVVGPVEIGKCVFPFVFNNEFVYDTTEPKVENAINDADTDGAPHLLTTT